MTGTRRAIRRVATIATVVLVGGLVGPLGAAADTPVATTFDELADEFAAGGPVALGADIAQTGQGLDVGAGMSVTLDLAGHSLSVTGVPAGDAAIGVPAGTTLTVVDPVGGGSITATGGTGGAGIGGGAGAPGVSTFFENTQAPGGPSGAAGTVTGGSGLAGSDGTGPGQGGGNGGSGGAVAGTAPVATGGGGANGGAGGDQASGGDGGAGGAEYDHRCRRCCHRR